MVSFCFNAEGNQGVTSSHDPSGRGLPLIRGIGKLVGLDWPHNSESDAILAHSILYKALEKKDI